MFKHCLASLIMRVTYAEDHVWAWRPGPCWQCGRPTHWVEVHFEAPTHRGRCTRDATQGWIAADNALTNALGRAHRG